MRRALIVSVVAALALAAAPGAAAKEIKNAEVCGSGVCSAVDDEQGRAALMTGGDPMEPPKAAPYYEVRAEWAHGDENGKVSWAIVPSREAVRYDDGSWYGMTPELSALIQKVTSDMKAFPAAGLVGAAEPPAPQPAPTASDGGGSLLWPEGVLLALALGVAGVFLVRAARPARFARGEGSRG